MIIYLELYLIIIWTFLFTRTAVCLFLITMKVAVIGSRDFDNLNLLIETLSQYKSEITLVVSGGSKGADAMAEQSAKFKTTSAFPNYTSQPNYLQLLLHTSGKRVQRSLAWNAPAAMPLLVRQRTRRSIN